MSDGKDGQEAQNPIDCKAKSGGVIGMVPHTTRAGRQDLMDQGSTVIWLEGQHLRLKIDQPVKAKGKWLGTSPDLAQNLAPKATRLKGYPRKVRKGQTMIFI
ncbi:hypothetical protein PAXRUDRAFT_19568 [Paxillus rubicundulus Ve08.2h10]|uniref:Uncharacterized protein n=1 Tax=Paxillus rubicundulus Ve08.2h10 TaxID=930991 RepID=A0A0D0BTI7_9AGAM|nr:hypothetical protein PAXRUDRAFT_19568 [Paxillus rubicundulus Ve08.2h10]